jgi:hypothetical protein
LRLPLLEPILFLVRSVSVDLNVIVRYWWHLDGVLHVSVIFALVLENVIGMILSYVTDVKVDLNVSAIFLFLMVIVRNALWLIVRVIHLFVLSVFRSMNVNATLIVIKLTNRDPDK